MRDAQALYRRLQFLRMSTMRDTLARLPKKRARVRYGGGYDGWEAGSFWGSSELFHGLCFAGGYSIIRIGSCYPQKRPPSHLLVCFSHPTRLSEIPNAHHFRHLFDQRFTVRQGLLDIVKLFLYMHAQKLFYLPISRGSKVGTLLSWVWSLFYVYHVLRHRQSSSLHFGIEDLASSRIHASA